MNNEAANLLIKYNKYAPSVHCSYYSFIQLAIKVLKEVFHKSIRDIQEQRESNGIRPGTHNAIMVEMLIQMEDQEYNKINEFHDAFEKAKSLRVRSDYFDSKITIDHAQYSQDLSDELIRHVNKLK